MRILKSVNTHIVILSVPFILAFIVNGCSSRGYSNNQFSAIVSKAAQEDCIIVSESGTEDIDGVYCKADIQVAK